MAIESHEETPAIIVLRERLKKLDESRGWHETNRDHGRSLVEDANARLVEIAGEVDSVEAALKTLVTEATQAALLQGMISQQGAVDSLGGIL